MYTLWKVRGEGFLQVHKSCFFEGAAQYSSDVLISNPPYLPAPDDDIMMPQLFGGTDGGGLTRVRLIGYNIGRLTC